MPSPKVRLGLRLRVLGWPIQLLLSSWLLFCSTALTGSSLIFSLFFFFRFVSQYFPALFFFYFCQKKMMPPPPSPLSFFVFCIFYFWPDGTMIPMESPSD